MLYIIKILWIFFFEHTMYPGIGIGWPKISGICIGIGWHQISGICIGIGWHQRSGISIGWNFGIGTSLIKNLQQYNAVILYPSLYS